ncbi:type I glyceraldehyde-3-phosphate dehydrogenase [Alicyclobacillus shizuokensis]|uniref:type I glyceraldehyde-3-phosphate dehydrogenase n=1 Tax=Alicyclobacillus shizuokensis TaxID=392014 RepID=UPI00082CF8FD|nr:type I glyceraldehyde-3-phosphate dehydrogenase [Alicyclobacillus shizuokensis]
MAIRMAINGFGRIGRMVYRRAAELDDILVVAVNGTADADTLLHLLRYDSVHGRFTQPLERTAAGWTLNGCETHVFSTRNPYELPWAELQVDVVVEATGRFRTRDGAALHLEQGARKVVVTAPMKSPDDADVTIVVGVNEDMYDARSHHIISGASCTTNCLAPVAKVLHRAFGIEGGLVTAIHAYTNDQRNLDNPHSDWRRARACGQSIIPTSTGAARAIGLVLPELQGRLDGMAVRVPTPNVSLLDCVLQLTTDVSAQTVNMALRDAADHDLAGVLGVVDDPLVSIDFNGDARSAIVDATATMVLGGHQVKLLAWYDNEWGYACRMVDLAQRVAVPAGEGASAGSPRTVAGTAW